MSRAYELKHLLHSSLELISERTEVAEYLFSLPPKNRCRPRFGSQNRFLRRTVPTGSRRILFPAMDTNW